MARDNRTVEQMKEDNEQYVSAHQAAHRQFQAERNAAYRAMQNKSREELDAEVEASTQRVDERMSKKGK